MPLQGHLSPSTSFDTLLDLIYCNTFNKVPASSFAQLNLSLCSSLNHSVALANVNNLAQLNVARSIFFSKKTTAAHTRIAFHIQRLEIYLISPCKAAEVVQSCKEKQLFFVYLYRKIHQSARKKKAIYRNVWFRCVLSVVKHLKCSWRAGRGASAPWGFAI